MKHSLAVDDFNSFDIFRCLGVPVSDHTYEDIRLMNYASQLDFPMASVLVEFAKLSQKMGYD